MEKDSCDKKIETNITNRSREIENKNRKIKY